MRNWNYLLHMKYSPDLIKPPKLLNGDLICIISPSSEIQSFPRRVERAELALIQAGFKVIFSKNAKKKIRGQAGTIQDRCDDIHEAFLNSDVKAIISSTGGYTSNTLLNFIDYNLIYNNPKILIGHSDISALLLAIYSKVKLVTFHGPSLLPSFGDKNGIHADTLQSLLNLTSEKKLLSFTDFETTSEDDLIWDKQDDRPREYEFSNGIQMVYPGKAKGILLGGNLETILGIINTPFFPSLNGSIFFLEECGGNFSKTLRDLKILESHFLFSKVSALVFGRPYNYIDVDKPYGLVDHLYYLGMKYKIPVLYNVPFGHTEPKLTFPIGVMAEIDTLKSQFKILEYPVL